MNSEDLEHLLALVRARSGLLLRGDKSYFVQSRLAPLARSEGADSVEALVQRLRLDDDERLTQAAVEAMTTTDTAFFRDKAVFDHIRDDLLPYLAGRRPDGVVNVWAAGCSTGQEVYSLAMLAEEARATTPELKLRIVGTDLSRRALEKAYSGLYTQFEVQRGLPIRRMLDHFEPVDDMWRISEALRRTVRWRQLNLLDERRSARPFDLILCRNVVSGFAPEVRTRVLDSFAPTLTTDGFLVLGSGETADTGAFELTSGACRIFRRRRIAPRVAA